MKEDSVREKKWKKTNIEKVDDDLIVEILAEAVRNFRRNENTSCLSSTC